MRLIDADAFVKEMEDRYNAAISWGKRAVASHDDEMRIRAEQTSFSFVEASLTAKKMPTINAVEVVRCKDCKRFTPNGCSLDVIDNFILIDSNKFFCAFGERKDEE